MPVLKAQSVSKLIADKLQLSLRDLPKGFHSTFKYTRTGNNLCHPITLALIGNAVGQLENVKYIGYDVRLNNGAGNKFQPDIVGFGSDLTPMVCVDFESPNSSDARIVEKDVAAYLRWVSTLDENHAAPPYIVVTSLPNFESDDWECRWIGPGRWNEKHRENVGQIMANPYVYWRNFWASQLGEHSGENIAFLNINDSEIMYVSYE